MGESWDSNGTEFSLAGWLKNWVNVTRAFDTPAPPPLLSSPPTQCFLHSLLRPCAPVCLSLAWAHQPTIHFFSTASENTYFKCYNNHEGGSSSRSIVNCIIHMKWQPSTWNCQFYYVHTRTQLCCSLVVYDFLCTFCFSETLSTYSYHSIPRIVSGLLPNWAKVCKDSPKLMFVVTSYGHLGYTLVYFAATILHVSLCMEGKYCCSWSRKRRMW